MCHIFFFFLFFVELLTLAVSLVDDGITVLESLDHPADKPLGSLWSSVDSDKTERSFRGRHYDRLRGNNIIDLLK